MKTHTDKHCLTLLLVALMATGNIVAQPQINNSVDSFEATFGNFLDTKDTNTFKYHIDQLEHTINTATDLPQKTIAGIRSLILILRSYIGKKTSTLEIIGKIKSYTFLLPENIKKKYGFLALLKGVRHRLKYNQA